MTARHQAAHFTGGSRSFKANTRLDGLAASLSAAYIVLMTDCDIFIDTNLVLHFQPIDQIDWCSLTGSTQCTIVIAPILLRELEHKKVFIPSAALKARAGRMIDFLVEKMALPDPIALRPNVVLAFAEHEPAIDFAAHQLAPEVNDDHYIATAIERNASSGRRTFIASNDGGMALKLRSRLIDILRLPDVLKLPAEVDAEQKDLRDARREIARLKSQRPKLLMRFSDGSAKREIRNARSIKHGAPAIEQIRLEHPILPAPEVKAEPFNGDLNSIGKIANLYGMGSRDRVERHNASLRDYYARYQRYLRELEAWTETLRLTTQISLKLQNDGSATATNLDVAVSFPRSVRVSSMRDWPKQPSAPEPPSKPGALSALDAYLGAGARIQYPRLLSPAFDFRDQAPYIDEDDPHTVHFSGKSLKQKCAIDFDKFLLTRDPALTGKGIELDIHITFHEGEPVNHKLAIIFSEVEAADSDD